MASCLYMYNMIGYDKNKAITSFFITSQDPCIEKLLFISGRDNFVVSIILPFIGYLSVTSISKRIIKFFSSPLSASSCTNLTCSRFKLKVILGHFPIGRL